MKLATIILSFVALLMSHSSSAQCDSIINVCQKHIAKNYISDGQVYRALLNGDDVAEFQTTLFGGNTYRIAVCSGFDDSNLIFRICDHERNLLFSNTDYNKEPYWDFYIENTMSVSIDVLLDSTRKDSGCAVVVIGFQK
jgi:hypothetical protein